MITTLLLALMLSDTANVSVNVTGRNDAPIARDDTYVTDEDTILDSSTTTQASVLVNDTDKDKKDTIIVARVNGQPVVAGQVITLPSGATLTMNANGTFIYNPGDAFQYLGEGEQATDSFTYQAANP